MNLKTDAATEEQAIPTKPKNILSDFLKSFFVPMLINKAFMLYFGLNYSDHPDEGYGYGLAITIVFFLFTIGKFLWAYKDVEDP